MYTKLYTLWYSGKGFILILVITSYYGQLTLVATNVTATILLYILYMSIEYIQVQLFVIVRCSICSYKMCMFMQFVSFWVCLWTMFPNTCNLIIQYLNAILLLFEFSKYINLLQRYFLLEDDKPDHMELQYLILGTYWL